MTMAPYRKSAAIVRADRLEDLFAAKCQLQAEGGLAYSYELLPWKRHVCAVSVTPESARAWLSDLARRMPVSIVVTRSDDVVPGRYAITGDWITRQGVAEGELQRGTANLDALARMQHAEVHASGACFELTQGELVFEVSGYELDELPRRFREAFPWEALGLPPLIGRDWSVVDRHA